MSDKKKGNRMQDVFSKRSVLGVDSYNFPAAKNIATAFNIIRQGSMRELHWHPSASENDEFRISENAAICACPKAGMEKIEVKRSEICGGLPC